MKRRFKHSHTIEDYEKKIEKQEKNLLEENNFLDKLKSAPFKVSRFETGFSSEVDTYNCKISVAKHVPILYTEDYSVAIDFEIKERGAWSNEISTSDHGRYYLVKPETKFGHQKYFEFFGKFKKYKVILENSELVKDKMDVLGNYSWEKGEDDNIDYVFTKNERINYFKSRGMKKSLINKIISQTIE